MKRIHHSPAYVMRFKRAWQVVVPIRGKLAPRICPEIFPTQASAEAWLRSAEGIVAVDILRGATVHSERHDFATPAT
jgi:hypothetical protein